MTGPDARFHIRKQNMKVSTALTPRRFTVLYMLIAALSATPLIGQPGAGPSLSPTETDYSKKADEFLAQWDKKDMPGCSVGAVKDGKVVYKRAFGSANLDHDVPNTTTTLFNLASVSKPFTAMSIALLAEQGKLSLDDDLRKYVPEMPKYDETITLRHLIHHTSGIREYQALVLFGGLGRDNAYSDKDILEMLARQKNVSFNPGSRYQYSNSNYHLLGIVVGRVSGKSLREFADENIFKPLGMKNTMFADDRFEVIKNRASGYMVGPGNSIRARSSLFDLVGGGGVLTTVEDLFLWTQNYLEPTVGTRDTIKLLTTPPTLPGGAKTNYAFGLWRVVYKGLPMLEHSGNMSGFRAKIFSFPEQKFTAIALCNNSAILPGTIADKLTDIYLEGHVKTVPPAAAKPTAATLPPAVPLPEKEAARFVGYYASRQSGAFFKLDLEGGKLMNTGLRQAKLPLIPIADNRFFTVDGGNKFEFVPILAASGTISGMKVIWNGENHDLFTPVKPPHERNSDYVGTYYSEEFDSNFKVAAKGSSLEVKVGEDRAPTLNPAYADVFAGPGGQLTLTFTRDDRGNISGFVFDSSVDGRDVKGVVFRRK